MNDPDIVRHYGETSLARRLADALGAAGLTGKRLSPAQLAPLDQFHAGGLAATALLADAANIQPGEHVIDIGSGLGGPSRYLAANCDCRVSGIDLNPHFVEAATFLAGCTEVAHRVDYQCANALHLPFANESFDVAWTQHVAMNIADRNALYTEIVRVLRPRARFAIYDAVARNGQEVIFPVPWSRTPATSFLLTEDDMRTSLEKQGLTTLSWNDRTEAAIKSFESRRTQSGSQPPSPLGLHLVMGPEFPAMTANFERNLREGRVGLVQAVMQRR